MKETRVAGLDAGAGEHMDGIYRTQRYIYNASRKYFLLGRDRLLDGLNPPVPGSVLEVGCGTGRNLILAARRYPHARLYGFDISRMMLETAQTSIARASLGARIRIAQADATAFSASNLFGIPNFDRVFISYTLSMIPPWNAALEKAFDAVAPGGELHIVDFGQQAGLPQWFKAVLRAWLAKFSVEPRSELETVLSQMAAKHGAQLSFERLYRDYAHHAILRKRQLRP